MKRLVVLGTVLIVGVSLAQAQGRSARGGERRGPRGPAAVQASPSTDGTRDNLDQVQRPIRQRLRDPNDCRAAQGRPLRQQLRDPAVCPRFNAASRATSPGMGWGNLRRGGRPGGWERPSCPRCGWSDFQSGRRQGWRGRG